MIAYLLKRLLAMVPTLLGITLVTFLMINLAPGDPVATSMGADQGPGADASGGNSQERQADTIKAKKKLLGMMREAYSVGTWDLDLGPAAEGEVAPIEAGASFPELDKWPRVLSAPSDASWFAGGFGDGFIRRYDWSGAELAAIEAHPETRIYGLAVSPDGSLLASSDTDGNLRIWDVATGDKVGESRPVNRAIRGLVWLPDNTALVSAGDDGRIRIHDPRNASVRATLEDHNNGAYALLLADDGNTLYSGGYDRKLRRWDLEAEELLGEPLELGQAIHDLAWSPDGSRIAFATADRKAGIVEVGESMAAGPLFEGHYKGVLSVAWSADGSQLYTGGIDEIIRVFDVSSGALVGQTPDKVGVTNDLLVHNGTLYSAADSWVTVPLVIRYFKWLARIATLDFDRSFVDDRKVIDKIGDALPITLGLNLIALTIIYVVAIPLGIYAAIRRNSIFDHVSSVILFVLYSVPSFWAATLLIMTFSSKANWDILPSVGLMIDAPQNLSYLDWLQEGLLHLVLPITVMVYTGFASLSRYARSTMLEVIGQDYIRTARAKGLSERVVVLKHAFRNSLITIVTLIANLLPAMIGGSVIIEYIFSINGMGKLGFDAILQRDYPTIMAITTFSAFLTLFGILVSDVLYSVVDPRIKVE